MSTAFGFYGKLPHMSDFISSETLSKDLAAFTSWLGAASEQLAVRLGSDRDLYSELPLLHIVIKLPMTSKATIAICKPSQDSGGRKAPFSIFAEVTNSFYRDSLSLIPDAFGLFLQVGRNCLVRTETAFSREQQRDTMLMLNQGLPIAMSSFQMQLAEFLHQTRLGQFIEAVAATSDEAEKNRLIKNVFNAVATSRKLVSDKFKAVFRFPLSPHPALHSHEMAIWIIMSEIALGRRLSEVTLLWTQDHFDIAFGENYESLLARTWIPSGDDDNLWDFVSMKLDDDLAGPAFNERLDMELTQTEKSLTGFLDSMREHITTVQVDYVKK